MGAVLKFVAGVVATVAVIYLAVSAVFALGQAEPEKMPPAAPAYESNEALRRLSVPCRVSYSYVRPDGRRANGCAK
jgi:hypothetical protein